MSKPNNEHDRLDRLTEAFANLPVPEGPDVEVTQRLLETLARTGDEPVTIPRVPFWRSKTMRKFTSAAAVLLVVLGFAIYSRSPIAGGPGVVFAAMIEQIKEIRTATFTTHVRMKGSPGATVRSSLLEPGWSRTEVMVDGKVVAVHIMNLREGVMLALMPEQKVATQLYLSNIPKSQRQESIVESFKKLPEDAAEFVGEEVIEGTTTLKYEVDQQDLSYYTVWLDPETKMPVKILMTDHADPAKSNTHLAMGDFDWGAEVDELLFTLDIPEGYELIEQSLDPDRSPEEDFAAMMRIYVRLNDDAFPDEWNLLTIVSMGNLLKKSEGTYEEKKQYAMKKIVRALEKPELFDSAKMSKKEQMELGLQFQQAIVSGAAFFETLTETHYCRYQGKGVKLGEADKIVFWWYPKKEKADDKIIEGADLETANVMYGDLRIETMPVAELPKPEEKK